MSKLRSLNTSFWSDTWIETLNPEEKLLFIYLVTNEKTNMLGIYEASIRKISFETGISQESVSNHLKGFERVGKVKYLNNYIILVNYMKHQNYNTNMKKSAIDNYNNLPNELKIKDLDVNKDNPLKGFERLLKAYGMVRKIEDEDEEEIEDEFKFNGSESNFNLERLKEFYLKDEKLIKAVISNKANKIKDVTHLEKRLKEFNLHCTETGIHSRTWQDYTSHFRNWNKKEKEKKQSESPTSRIAL